MRFGKVLVGITIPAASVLSYNSFYASDFDLSSDKIYISGDTIGLSVKGEVEVVGTFAVSDASNLVKPWERTSIQKGDKILEVNGKEVDSIVNFKKMISSSSTEDVELKLSRNGTTLTETLTRTKNENGDYTLGLYVKDKIMGVGTLTYVIKDSQIFGSLGHNLGDTLGEIDGSILEANLVGVKKAESGQVGEKKAKLTRAKLGEVFKNTSTGVHGKVSSNFSYKGLKSYSVAKKEEVHEGKATILTNISGDEVEEFEIEIYDMKKQESSATKSFKVKVVDDDLIDQTGGIIQGMSGSPIIQDGKAIGALTHVFVNSPTSGYGIFLEWMLQDGGVTLK